jgi:hypothetical protein
MTTTSCVRFAASAARRRPTTTARCGRCARPVRAADRPTFEDRPLPSPLPDGTTINEVALSVRSALILDEILSTREKTLAEVTFGDIRRARWSMPRVVLNLATAFEEAGRPCPEPVEFDDHARTSWPTHRSHPR